MTRDSGTLSQLGPGPEILEQAHAFVAFGVPIFSVFGVFYISSQVTGERYACTCGRGNSVEDGHKPGKHPASAHGHLDAALMDDLEIVRVWGDGDKNLAYATGNGLLVVDVDEKHDGLQTLDDWEQWTGFALPETLMCRTGGGGLHLLYRYSPTVRVNTQPGLLPGVDLKGDGGYCVAAGSRHISGDMYRWLNPGTPVAWTSEVMNRWLLTDARAGSGSGLGTPATYDYTQGAVAGQRDAFFNDLAFRSRKEGLSYEEAWRRQRSAWENTEQPVGDVFPWEHALSKLDRVWRRVQPDADISAARDALERWNTARNTGQALRLGYKTIIARENTNGEML